jgi:hypothetical protein
LKAQLCRLQVDKTGNGIFESVEEIDLSLETLYREDAKYGYLKPLDPKKSYLTYRVYNGDDEMPQHVADYIARLAFQGWINEVKMSIRPAKAGEEPDIKIRFDDEDHDKTLTSNTIAYMYYPINTVSQYRGVCVINRRFYYSISGTPISMHILDPVHYPDPNTKTKGKTWDLDKILRHEFGHGLFGLIHDGKSGNTMSSSYEHMSEELTVARDIARAARKVGRKIWQKIANYARWRKWYYGTKSEVIPDWLLV